MHIQLTQASIAMATKRFRNFQILRYCFIFFLVPMVATPAVADGDVANGKALIKKWDCVSCHGITGNTRSTPSREVPMLAGQPAAYLVKRLAEYKSGKLGNPDEWSRMGAVVQGLSESDMQDIATYYEIQKRY